MACKDCLLNCDTILSDQCVQYTGPAIPLLGICTGDSLSQLESAIVSELLSVLDGIGITPSGVTISCEFLQDIIAASTPNLANILQMLVTASCTLKDMIDTINEQIADSTVFDTACLTVPTDPTRDDILQAAVTLLCSINTTVAAIPTTYVKNSDLTTLVTQIVNQINSGGSTVIQNNTRMVPFSVMGYFGPLANFDSGGAGIAALGYEKIYLCNGQNGTPDLRGRVLVGALRNVPGGTLDNAVDPAVSANNPQWALNDKAGESFHTLVTGEIPSHTHTITDPGHSHSITFSNSIHAKDQGSTQIPTLGLNPTAPVTISDRTGTSTTGITIGSTGSGSPHNNIQPSLAGYYIMYIP